MQQFSFFYIFINLFGSALHISGDNFAHLKEMELVPSQPCQRSAAISVHCTKSCTCSQKLLLKMGEFVARNMQSRFKQIHKEINKRKLLHLVGSSTSTFSPFGSNSGALYQKLYMQSKVLLKMGEFVARNMQSRFKQINIQINKRNMFHLVGCLHRCSNDARSH